jgi:hypothetical protein
LTKYIFNQYLKHNNYDYNLSFCGKRKDYTILILYVDILFITRGNFENVCMVER